MSMAEGDNLYEKYLEKNYDSSGNVVERYKQKADDSFEAEQINKRAQVYKEGRKEEITERLLEKEAVTKEEIDELMGEYAGNETEYLVNGALLSCDRATRNPVKLTIDGQKYNFECPQLPSMDSTTLMVEENGQSSNGLYMATVGDTKMVDIIAGDKFKGKNIAPFSRNCSLPPDRKDEEDRIKNNLGICKSRGTCTALMKLSDEWENVPSDTEYLSYKDNGVDKSAINMMSMLFCKHGGLITPVRSGQTAGLLLLVTFEQLSALNWHKPTLEEVKMFNTILKKYDITTPERIRHFLAQCMKETERGSCLTEGGYINWPSQQAYEAYYNNNTKYKYKYRGSGYIQLTWEYGYQAFATFLIQQKYSDLNIEWVSPKRTNTGFKERYEEAVKKAEEAGYNVDVYKKIVTEGADYVADEYAWEAAGYDWYAKGLNEVVDKLAPDDKTEADKVTEIVNKWTPTDSYEARRDYYEEVSKVIN